MAEPHASARPAHEPRFAVLIPAYNCQEKLEATLRSLQSQELDATIYVVDDGSHPPLVLPDIDTASVKLVRLEKNQGIVGALNTGIAAITPTGVSYIARLDCGDLYVPGRFAAQVHFLEANPDHVVVGTAADYIDPAGKLIFNHHPPEDHAKISRQIRYNSPHIHPSVMLRVEALSQVGGYRDKFMHAEDYDLFFRLSQVGKLANLPQAFLKYEVSPGQLSQRWRARQQISRIQIQLHYFDALNPHAYFGIVISSILTLLPKRYVTALKALNYRMSSARKGAGAR